MRPIVFHAGCGGEVTVERVGPGLPTITCQQCDRRIVDPLELLRRESGFVPDRDVRQVARYRLEA